MFDHSEQETFYDTTNKWIFVSVSTWKNSINGDIGFLLGPLGWKSLNILHCIKPRMMCASFNGNPCSTIASCYSPIKAINGNRHHHLQEQAIWPYFKHNVLIIGGDMNAYVNKVGNDKTEMRNI